jgi:hypothetical protein
MYMKVRLIDPNVFDDVAGSSGQLLVVILPDGKYEILAPEGAEVEESAVPDHEVTALLTLRSASYYEKCKRGWVHVCCNGVCRKKRPAERC